MRKMDQRYQKRIWALLLCLAVLSFSGCTDVETIEHHFSYVAGDNPHYQIAIDEGGTLKVQGEPDETFDFDGWTDIVSVSAGFLNAGAIKSDGTVVVTGDNRYGACDVDKWRDIEMLDFTVFVTYGLRSDGTIVHTGDEYKQEKGLIEKGIFDEVDTWQDITYMDASQISVVGVKSDGKVVVSSPFIPEMAEQVADWENVKMVSTSVNMIVGLTDCGRVLVALDNVDQNLVNANVLAMYSDMEGAVKVCAGQSFVAGLMPDGMLRVRIVCPQNRWEQEVKDLDGEENVQDISSYEDGLFVLKKDGTILSGGYIQLT